MGFTRRGVTRYTTRDATQFRDISDLSTVSIWTCLSLNSYLLQYLRESVRRGCGRGAGGGGDFTIRRSPRCRACAGRPSALRCSGCLSAIWRPVPADRLCISFATARRPLEAAASTSKGRRAPTTRGTAAARYCTCTALHPHGTAPIPMHMYPCTGARQPPVPSLRRVPLCSADGHLRKQLLRGCRE